MAHYATCAEPYPVEWRLGRIGRRTPVRLLGQEVHSRQDGTPPNTERIPPGRVIEWLGSRKRQEGNGNDTRRIGDGKPRTDEEAGVIPDCHICYKVDIIVRDPEDLKVVHVQGVEDNVGDKKAGESK